MASSPERVLLITVRARVGRGAVPAVVFDVARHRMSPADAPPADVTTTTTASTEAVVGLVRDWLTEFVATD